MFTHVKENKINTTITTPVSQPLSQDNVGKPAYQKGKTSLDLNEARDDGVWGMQWHQLDHMQTILHLAPDR